jgi:hypothetical protein
VREVFVFFEHEATANAPRPAERRTSGFGA